MSQDLLVRGATACDFSVADLCQMNEHETLLAAAEDKLGVIDIVLIAHGTLPDQNIIQDNYQASLEALTTNGLSAISLMQAAAKPMMLNERGTIAVISSVAGDRGRQSNYVYGTAKAMVSTFAQGLRNRLSASGVHVITIKPGFVDTPMTKAVEKNFLFAKADQVAADIVTGIEKKRNIIYTPFFWRYILLIIKFIPESIFKKLKL